jgi:hypothetical protein
MNGNIRILPGHYMDWSEMAADGKFMESLAVIMKNNHRIYDITDAQVFTDFIRANMRQQPEVYARIRQVNAGLLEPDGEEQKIMDIGKNECAASHA